MYLGTIPSRFPGEELEHVYQRHSKCLLCHLKIFLQYASYQVMPD